MEIPHLHTRASSVGSRCAEKHLYADIDPNDDILHADEARAVLDGSRKGNSEYRYHVFSVAAFVSSVGAKHRQKDATDGA